MVSHRILTACLKGWGGVGGGGGGSVGFRTPTPLAWAGGTRRGVGDLTGLRDWE